MIKIKKQFKQPFLRVLYWVFLLFLIYLIFELTRKIFGGSLGFEEIVIGLLIANLGFSFYMRGYISEIDSKISGHLGWHKGINNK